MTFLHGTCVYLLWNEKTFILNVELLHKSRFGAQTHLYSYGLEPPSSTSYMYHSMSFFAFSYAICAILCCCTHMLSGSTGGGEVDGKIFMQNANVDSFHLVGLPDFQLNGLFNNVLGIKKIWIYKTKNLHFLKLTFWRLHNCFLAFEFL